MGLDMYLFKTKKVDGYSFQDILNVIGDGLDEENLTEGQKKLLDLGVVTDSGSKYWRYSFTEEVAYWRKANQIHNWFVEHVQHGQDDCGYYEVDKNQLQTLLATCKRVISACELEDGQVMNGQILNTMTGKWEPNWEDGKQIKKGLKTAQKLLPTTSGCFFGSTDYDQWYYKDLETTVEQLEKILEEVDFDQYHITYSSSW